jgi:hypothetical protein
VRISWYACAAGAFLSLGLLEARGSQWRRAGSGPSRDVGAVAVVPAEFDPFEESAPSGAAVQLAAESEGPPRSVVVRREPAPPAGYDPFEEDAGAIEPAMPPAEPAGEVQHDPFEADDAAAMAAPRSPQSPVVETTPIIEAPAVVEEPPVAVPAPVEEPIEEPAPEFNVQEAFDEPAATIAIRPADAPSAPAVSGELNEELEAGEAIEDEVVRREVDGDRPEGVGPDVPRGAKDDVLPPELEEEFAPPVDDDESDADEYDPRFQLAPGEYDIRPLDPPAALTPEQQEARRQQLEQERALIAEDCEEILETVRADDIKSVSLDIRMYGEAGEDYPFECGLGEDLFQARSWPQITYMWKAAGLCHKPLYFEQVQLERYGHSWPPVVQPLLSGAHFFGTLPILPYKMGLTTPNECIYTLGYYRPGSCAPYMIHAVPFTWRAAAFEMGAWTGGSFIFP